MSFGVIQHTFEDKFEYLKNASVFCLESVHVNQSHVNTYRCTHVHYEEKCRHVHYEANVHMDILLNVFVETLQMSLV